MRFPPLVHGAIFWDQNLRGVEAVLWEHGQVGRLAPLLDVSDVARSPHGNLFAIQWRVV